MQSHYSILLSNVKITSTCYVSLTVLLLLIIISIIIYHAKPNITAIMLASTSKQMTLHLDILHSRKQLTSNLNVLHHSNQPALKRFVSTSSEAKCIDGSTPVYYIRKGRDEGANKWVVHFEGGGWCYDLQACYLRSKTGLGSSSGYPDIMGNNELPLYLSEYSSVNPLMYNWNVVYVKYCDGASYAGNTVAYHEGTLNV